jgi:hypothetical protein
MNLSTSATTPTSQRDEASAASMKLTWAANEVDFGDSFGSNGHGRDGLGTS